MIARRSLAGAAGLGFVLAFVLLALSERQAAGVAAVGSLAAASLSLFLHPRLRPFAFTSWVVTFVTASLVWPTAFGTWGGVDLKVLIVPLIQVITFGMGTTLSLDDFGRVLRMPGAVFLGFLLQFSIMPVIAWCLASALSLSPETAAGIILVGSVSGGVASNLITYLAGGNVALSVTMTACSTLASPLMTPLLMKLLAGRLVPIDFFAMVIEILNMVIVPIISGVLANAILYSGRPVFRQPRVLLSIAAMGCLVSWSSAWIPAASYGVLAPLRGGVVLGGLLLAFTATGRWFVTCLLRRPDRWMDRLLPLVSMSGICFIIAIITARSRQNLLTVGPVLIVAAAIHNGLGYLLGYLVARGLGMRETDARTIAIEVGMQNAGMASGLAMGVLKSAETALAPAIFGPWMNVSGSLLASWWRRRPPEPTKDPNPVTS